MAGGGQFVLAEGGQFVWVFQLGANTYVVKPSSYNDLLQTIDVINKYWLKTAEKPSLDDME
jgi:DNA-binding response OmpR family regulator